METTEKWIVCYEQYDDDLEEWFKRMIVFDASESVLNFVSSFRWGEKVLRRIILIGFDGFTRYFKVEWDGSLVLNEEVEVDD